MAFIVLNISFAAECLLLLLCLHMVQGRKLQFNLGLLSIFLSNNILFCLQYYNVIPRICAYIIYLLLFFYCYRVFQKKLIEILLRFLIGIMLAGIIEVVTTFGMAFFNLLGNNQIITIFVASLISLFIAYAAYYCFFTRKKYGNDNRQDKFLILLLALCGIVLIGLLVDFGVNHDMDIVTTMLTLVLCVVLVVYYVLLQKRKQDIAMRDMELDMHKIYGDTYCELQKEVRRRQHDYKNQLTTLQSMHLVARNLEELIEMQNQYSATLKEDNQYEQILTCCNNSIMAGYLYYRCMAFDKEKVKVTYEVNVDHADCKMRLHEIIEILGILLDNAYEYINEHEQVERRISLRVWEESDSFSLMVRNPAKYFTSQEIENMFSEGYSTKGNDRGIGLGRVKQLINRYQAVLIIEYQEHEGLNWIEFKIVIEKKKG